MTLDEFEQILAQIQNNSTENKTLRAMFTLAKYVTNLSDAVVTLQNKVNQMIIEVNEMKAKAEEKENSND